MIEKITVNNGMDNPTEIELSNPYSHGINISGIDGIGPGLINITQVEMATIDGSTITSVRKPSRNIVFTIKPMFVTSVEDTRLRVYSLFPLKRFVRLDFQTENRKAYIEGVVDKVEPNIFEEEVTMQVSMICADPYFKAASPGILEFSKTIPLFEFPFMNEGTTPQLLMGEIRDYLEQELFYEGDADTGIEIHIFMYGDVKEDIEIHNVANRESMTIRVSKMGSKFGYLKALDEIVVSTVKGNKYMKLIREGISYDILNFLDRDVTWIQLRPGNNMLTYVAGASTYKLAITMIYSILYAGI